MHSRVIALNIDIDQDEVFDYMCGYADYVDEIETNEDWALEILERIGTVDRDALTFKADASKVKEKLEAAFNHFTNIRIKTLEEFLNGVNVYRTIAALEDKFGIYVCTDWSGYPVVWLEFLRELWNNPELMAKTWNITHIFDYHS